MPLSIRARLFRIILKQMMTFQFPQDTPITEQRATMEQSVKRFFKLPAGVEAKPIMAGSVPAEWVAATSSDPNRVILYLHGGAYTTGSPATHRDLTGRLAVASRARLLVLDYRLAPEHPYPAAVEDALEAYRWLLANDIQPKQIVLAGDSAGAGLALALMLSLREANQPLPAAAICLSPWTDLAFTGDSLKACAGIDPFVREADLRIHARRYIGELDPHLPLISPHYADLHGLPPLLIHVGSHEILLSDSTRLADRAREQGVEVTLKIGDGLWHTWHIYASFVPEAQSAIEEIGKFLASATP